MKKLIASSNVASSNWPRNSAANRASPVIGSNTTACNTTQNPANPTSNGRSAAASSSTNSGASPTLANAGSTTKCSNHRPPTQNVWASCQVMVPPRTGRNSDMTNLDDLVFDQSARRLHRDHIAFFLADQRTSDR